STDIDAVEITSKQSLPVGIIITELITNSIKYAFTKSHNNIDYDEEGQIHISIFADRESPDFLCIEVSDNGKGMPSEIAEKGEYGFGLTLVESYAQQYNGSMSIHSEAGTTVRVTLEME
ncbi:MAG: sensor histidine kinase, partial [Sediminispirochaetaceae bacterium]